MITNINETKTNFKQHNEKQDAIKILENDQQSNSEITTDLPVIKPERRAKRSFEDSENHKNIRPKLQYSIELNKQNIKNYAEIRDNNRTMNRLVSISHKNLDLKKILEHEKIEEIKKYNFIERLLHGSHQNQYHERIFEKNPLQKENENFIKNRIQVKIRNKKLSMNNLLLSAQKTPDYIVKNIKKAPNIYDLNNNIKLKMLEKDVEMQQKYLNEFKALQDSNSNNNTINNKHFNNLNNNFNNDKNLNFNNFENNFTNTHITITNQTNFLKETINSILDESVSTQKIKSKNNHDNSKNYNHYNNYDNDNNNDYDKSNSKNNELENNFFNEEHKNLNFDFDESEDINASQSSKKNKRNKNEIIHERKQSNINDKSGKKRNANVKNNLENFGYQSSSESEEFQKNVNYNTYKNLSKNNFHNNNKTNKESSDIDESSIFDIKSDLKSLENKKEINNNPQKRNQNKKSVEYSSSFVYESSKNLNQIKPGGNNNEKRKKTRKSIILLNQSAHLDLKNIDSKKLIHNIYDMDSQRKCEEANKNKNHNRNKNKNENLRNSKNLENSENTDKNPISCEDASESVENSATASSENFLDEEKIQKLDDSGVLKPVKYESVYFKSLKKIQNENNLHNPAKLNPADISFTDIEPQHKTKKEIEQIKNSIKEIMKRRFDFSDEYLNDLHKKLQKKIIDVDPNYESVKNKYAQYQQQKILAKRECDTSVKLHILNKNPIMQVNNMVSFPMIINDPMLLASIYNVNMFNLEYTNNQIK